MQSCAAAAARCAAALMMSISGRFAPADLTLVEKVRAG